MRRLKLCVHFDYSHYGSAADNDVGVQLLGGSACEYVVCGNCGHTEEWQFLKICSYCGYSVNVVQLNTEEGLALV